jgi:hypothetical protein
MQLENKMVNEGFRLRFTWELRKENADQCASRLEQYLASLKSIDSIFDNWVGVHPRGNLEFFENYSAKQWFALGVSRDPSNDKLEPELGHMIMLIASSGLQTGITCGAYCPGVNNVCNIIFNLTQINLPRILHVSTLIKIVGALVEAWEPERGVLTSPECFAELSPKSLRFDAGWFTYISESRMQLIKLPKGARVEKIGKGNLIIATEEDFSSKNRKHMKFVRELSLALEGAG